MAKIKWTVSEAATGRYSSFQRRGWPTGEINGCHVVSFGCEDDYVPANVKEGRHGPITVFFANRRDDVTGWKRYRLKTQFKTLGEAKLAAQLLFDKHPEYLINKAADDKT